MSESSARPFFLRNDSAAASVLQNCLAVEIRVINKMLRDVLTAQFSKSVSLNEKSGMTLSQIILFVLAICLGEATAFNSACAQGNPNVVATVNGRPITSADVNAAMAKLYQEGKGNDNISILSKDALNKLINQALADQAVDPSLEQNDPELSTLIDRARRSAIYEYFVAKQLGPPKEIAPSRITAFVRDNPSLFKDRKAYYFTLLTVTLSDTLDLSSINNFLRTEASVAKSSQPPGQASDPIPALVGWLGERKADFASSKIWRTSEQIDPEVLNKLSSISFGSTVVDTLDGGKRARVITLYAATPDPVDPRNAFANIAQGMMAQDRAKQEEDLFAKLRAEADIRIGPEAATSVYLDNRPAWLRMGVAAWRSIAVPAWCFSLLVLFPLWSLLFVKAQLSRKDPRLLDPNMEVIHVLSKNILRFSYKGPIKSAIIAAIALVLGFTSYEILAGLNVWNFPKTLMIASSVGIFGGLLLAVTAATISPVKSVFMSHRWLGLIIILVGQGGLILARSLGL